MQTPNNEKAVAASEPLSYKREPHDVLQNVNCEIEQYEKRIAKLKELKVMLEGNSMLARFCNYVQEQLRWD